MTTSPTPQRLAGRFAPQPQAAAPVSVDDGAAGWDAHRVPAAVRLRLRGPARPRPRRLTTVDGAYLNYVVPGLLLVTVAAAVQGTAIMVAMDMTGGIIDRFRTMAIARASVLTGHVLGSLSRPWQLWPFSSASPSVSGSAPRAGPSRGWPRSACWPCSRSR